MCLCPANGCLFRAIPNLGRGCAYLDDVSFFVPGVVYLPGKMDIAGRFRVQDSIDLELFIPEF